MFAALCLVLSAAAQAGECAARFGFTFADGSRGCLTDYALADRTAAGWIGPIRRLVPISGLYTIASATPAAQCPASAGYADSRSLATQSTPTNETPAARAEQALRGCRSGLDASAPAGADCRCVLLVEDGVSPLTRAQWEPWRVPTAAAAAQAAAPAVVTAPAQAPAAGTLPQRPAPAAATPPPPAATATLPVSPPVAAPRTPTPPAAPPPRADPAGSPSAAELAALRQQIEALRAEMARAAAAPSATAAATPPPPPAAPARKPLRARALVIGNGAYTGMGALANPRRDAEAIATRLRRFGIEVDLALDTTRTALVKALSDYHERAAGYDVNILFYAGHGLQVGGINYIVPVDLPAAGATVGSVKLNAVSLNDALEYLPARTRLVFLDACRDNPLARSLMAARSGAGIGLAPVHTVSGTLVAYATKDGSTAEDGSGRNSPYTTALLEHLDAEEDIAVVLRRVRQSVLKATNQRQEPWEYGSLVGDQLVLSRLAR